MNLLITLCKLHKEWGIDINRRDITLRNVPNMLIVSLMAKMLLLHTSPVAKEGETSASRTRWKIISKWMY